jgi:hypothetical protein
MKGINYSSAVESPGIRYISKRFTVMQYAMNRRPARPDRC